MGASPLCVDAQMEQLIVHLGNQIPKPFPSGPMEGPAWLLPDYGSTVYSQMPPLKS